MSTRSMSKSLAVGSLKERTKSCLQIINELHDLPKTLPAVVTSGAEQLQLTLKIFEVRAITELALVQSLAEYRAVLLSDDELWDKEFPEYKKKEEESHD